MFLPSVCKKLGKSTVSAANSSNQLHNCRLFVRDTLNNLNFLVDTGADVSVLPHTLFTKGTKSINYCLSAANGTHIDTFGTKLLQVNIGLRRQFVHTFLLASVSRPILGADFLTKHKLLVDLKASRSSRTTTHRVGNYLAPTLGSAVTKSQII